MEQTEMLRRMQQKTFFKNNGMVLKAVNLLRDKYVSLSDVCYALHPSMNEAEFRDAVNYLTESGYIRLADTEMQELEAKVTAEGIQIIACVRTDVCIDV